MSQALPLLLVAGVALGFGLWPAVSHRSGDHSGWLDVHATLLPTIMITVYMLITSKLGAYPRGADLTWQVSGGVINGAGMMLYLYILKSPQYRHLAPMCIVAMVAVLTLSTAAMNGQLRPSKDLCLAVIFSCGAAYFFNRLAPAD